MAKLDKFSIRTKFLYLSAAEELMKDIFRHYEKLLKPAECTGIYDKIYSFTSESNIVILADRYRCCADYILKNIVSGYRLQCEVLCIEDDLCGGMLMGVYVPQGDIFIFNEFSGCSQQGETWNLQGCYNERVSDVSFCKQRIELAAVFIYMSGGIDKIYGL